MRFFRRKPIATMGRVGNLIIVTAQPENKERLSRALTAAKIKATTNIVTQLDKHTLAKSAIDIDPDRRLSFWLLVVKDALQAGGFRVQRD